MVVTASSTACSWIAFRAPRSLVAFAELGELVEHHLLLLAGVALLLGGERGHRGVESSTDLGQALQEVLLLPARGLVVITVLGGRRRPALIGGRQDHAGALFNNRTIKVVSDFKPLAGPGMGQKAAWDNLLIAMWRDRPHSDRF
jgi:hypothetical protein